MLQNIWRNAGLDPVMNSKITVTTRLFRIRIVSVGARKTAAAAMAVNNM